MEHGTVKALLTERGATYSYYDCKRQLEAAVRRTQRWFARTLRTRTDWADADMRQADLRDLRWILSDMAGYVEIIQRELDRIEGVSRTEERVRALREVAGRTPEEAEAFLRKADALERGIR